MDWIEKIWGQLDMYISVPYLVIFMLLAYFVKSYFGDFLQRITKFEWKTVYTVLVLATLTAIPFLLFSEEGWVKILFSYTLGTSLHESVFKWIANKFTG